MASALTACPLSDGIQAASDYGSYNYDYNDNDSLVFLGEDELQHFGGTFSGVLYTLIFILSLVGNNFLLWVLLVREDRRKTTTIFLLQLAVSAAHTDAALLGRLSPAALGLRHARLPPPRLPLLPGLLRLHGVPGGGDSGPLPGRVPRRADAAAAVWAVRRALQRLPVAGVHRRERPGGSALRDCGGRGRDSVQGGGSAVAPGAAGIRRAGQPVLPPPLRPHPLLLRAHLGHRVQVQVGQAGTGRAADLLHGAGDLRLLGALQRGAAPGRPAAPGLPRADGARGRREAGVRVLRVPRPGLLPLLPQPRPPRLRQRKVPRVPLRPSPQRLGEEPDTQHSAQCPARFHLPSVMCCACNCR